MKRLLLTGATGLIGLSLQRLIPAMLDEDVQVTLASRADLPNTAAWNRLPSFDLIIHAAGYASPALFLAKPLDTAFLNTTALMILLSKLSAGGRLLFLSTSEVYSGSNAYTHTENDIGTTTPMAPRGIYIESKRCGEAICHAAASQGKAAIAARVALAYGPGVKRNDKRVMSEFIEQALSMSRITLKDGGSARRTYCYVDDISRMLLTILLRGTSSVYNVGGRSEITIHGLAQRIGRALNAPVIVPRKTGTALEGSPMHVTLDMSRYTREFGEPRYIDWDEGLSKTIAWHREMMHGRETVAA